MFDLSFAEIAMVVVVGVLVIGPKELPAVLRQIGRFMRQIKGISGQFRQQLEMMDGVREMQQLRQEFREEVRIIENEHGEQFESYDISDLLPQNHDMKIVSEGEDDTPHADNMKP